MPVSPPEGKPPDLGYQRTRLAADRTLMAWIRTSVSMISFGFTIFKFFMYLRESNLLSGQLPMYGPRNLGLGLVGLGIFLLGMAIVEYLLYQRWLSREMKQKFPLSTALITALLLTVIGILALVNLLFNVGPL
jgi:putative membrane protein